jgi:hypothetical protein
MKRLLPLLGLILMLGVESAAAPVPVYQEVPFFDQQVKNGKLPPVAQRLPEDPAVAAFDWSGQVPGQYGGQLNTLMSSPKDTRYVVTYSYAQLVAYDAKYNLVPNILENFDIQGARIFTFHLRKGQKWSDGSPFTTEISVSSGRTSPTTRSYRRLGRRPTCYRTASRPRWTSSMRRRSATAGAGPTPTSCRHRRSDPTCSSIRRANI